MRKTILLMALLAPLYLGAQSAKPDSLETEFGLYYQRFSAKDTVAQRYFSESYRYLTKNTGIFDLMYGESRYASGTIGYFVDFLKYLEIGAAVGGETFPDNLGQYGIYGRYAAIFRLGGEHNFLDTYCEDGPSKKSWCRANLLFESENFAAGILAQTDDGLGPRLRVSVPRTYIRAWAAPMWKGSLRERKFAYSGLLLGGEVVWNWKNPAK